MSKYLTIVTLIFNIIFPVSVLAQETMEIPSRETPSNAFFNSTSTGITYETQEVITQSFYQTIEANQVLIYTRGNCENLNLLPQIENMNIPYLCRSIDQQEQYRELVVLLYDRGLGGSIPLPVVYYYQKVLFNPTLEQIDVLTIKD